MSNNVIEQAIRPEVPDVIPNEFFYVYVPKATTTNPGIASFDADDFNVANGVVTIDTTKWGDKDYIAGKLVASANRIVRGSTNYAVAVDTTLKTINITSTDSETLEDGTVRSIPTTYNIPFKAGQGTTFVLNDNIIAVKSDVGVLGTGTSAEIFNDYDGGSGNQASGDRSHAEGFETSAGGFASHAEGRGSGASGDGSHAEGWSGAVGDYSHSEGYYSSADNDYSHAEGNGSQAKGVGSHAEGYQTVAYGRYTHAEGYKTQAASNDIIIAAHAEGNETKALGHYSHAEGDNTIAIGQSQHVFGKYNVSDSNNVEIVGWGTSSERKNIRTLSPSGNEWISGKYTQEGTPTNNKDLTTKLYVDTIAASLDEDITTLKAIVGTGENYVGQLSGDALPSSSDLDDYVQEQEGRTPKGGDTIMFVLYVTGGEDEIYKYMYNGTTWASFMIPAVEVSANGELGVVKGTYGIGSTNDILVDIVNGEIKNIYSKDKESNYVKMGLPASITETVASVAAGTTGYNITCEVMEERVDNTSFSYDQVRNLPIVGGTGVSLSVEDNLVKIDAEVTKSYVDTQDNAVKSYVDTQDTTINNRITDSNIRINNLEKSVYGELADWSDETFLALKSAILPSTITVDSSTYNIINGANGILSSVKGNTKQFNQLVQNGNFTKGTGGTQYWVAQNTSLSVNNNVCTMTVTNSQNSCGIRQQNYLTGIVGHKYYFSCEVKCSIATTNTRVAWDSLRTIVSAALTANEKTKLTGFITVTNGGTQTMYIYIDNVQENTAPIGTTMELSNVQLFDLTAMGLDSITTVEEFTALYQKAYYPYNAGTLYNSVISGLALTGRNLWNGEVEGGGISNATGEETSGANSFRSKWIILDKNKAPYYFTMKNFNYSNYGTVFYFYDIDKNYISSTEETNSFTKTFTSSNIPDRTYYVRFRCYLSNSGWGTTPPSVTGILNFSDPSFNGQYEPYALRTITLPSPQTLCGVNTAQDEWKVTRNTSDDYYTVKKTVKTDTVTLDGTKGGYNSTSDWYYISNSAIGMDNYYDTTYRNLLCDKLVPNDVVSSTSKYGIGYNTSGWLLIRIQGFTTSQEYQNWLATNLPTVRYVKATPVETTITTTATLAEVSAIRTNGGMISVVGNDNEDYAQPDVSETILHSVTPNA